MEAYVYGGSVLGDANALTQTQALISATQEDQRTSSTKSLLFELTSVDI